MKYDLYMNLIPTAHNNDLHVIWSDQINHKRFISVSGVNGKWLNYWAIASDQDSLNIFIWSYDQNDKLLVYVLNAPMTSRPIIWIDQ